MLDSFQAIPDRWDIEVLLGISLDEARCRLPRELASLEQQGEFVRMRTSMPDLDAMARRLVALGCPLTIVGPPELRAAFLKLAAEIAEIARA
jgi:hypothetical protein